MMFRWLRRATAAIAVAVCCLFSAGSNSQLATTVPPELVIQTGHSSRVNCAVFAPNGRWLATGAADNSIRLWDTASRSERLLPAVHTDRVSGLCFSPDGNALASASYDHTVCLWDVKTGQPRWRVEVTGAKESRSWMTSVNFNPDGATLASGADDGVVRIWDTATGRQLQALRASNLPVFSVGFSPDGKTLACASNDTTIHLWDVRPNVPLRQYLQVYRFEGLDLTPLPAVNLYGDNGFRALEALQRRDP